MRQIIKYCPFCKRGTIHSIEHDFSIAERIFLGITTLGFSELVNDKNYRCEECGKSHIE